MVVKLAVVDGVSAIVVDVLDVVCRRQDVYTRKVREKKASRSDIHKC